mmetsp:Transcript_58454/g.139448  ORF Transcript_58454/g.139448 Transcript_58454/m.139448 type:complete len:205 (+) Transcript_58454:338-952(+)
MLVNIIVAVAIFEWNLTNEALLRVCCFVSFVLLLLFILQFIELIRKAVAVLPPLSNLQVAADGVRHPSKNTLREDEDLRLRDEVRSIILQLVKFHSPNRHMMLTLVVRDRGSSNLPAPCRQEGRTVAVAVEHTDHVVVGIHLEGCLKASGLHWWKAALRGTAGGLHATNLKIPCQRGHSALDHATQGIHGQFLHSRRCRRKGAS